MVEAAADVCVRPTDAVNDVPGGHAGGRGAACGACLAGPLAPGWGRGGSCGSLHDPSDGGSFVGDDARWPSSHARTTLRAWLPMYGYMNVKIAGRAPGAGARLCICVCIRASARAYLRIKARLADQLCPVRLIGRGWPRALGQPWASSGAWVACWRGRLGRTLLWARGFLGGGGRCFGHSGLPLPGAVGSKPPLDVEPAPTLFGEARTACAACRSTISTTRPPLPLSTAEAPGWPTFRAGQGLARVAGCPRSAHGAGGRTRT